MTLIYTFYKSESIYQEHYDDVLFIFYFVVNDFYRFGMAHSFSQIL